MAETVRLTTEQRREAMERAIALARSVAALSDLYPYPPDRHHIDIEEQAQALLALIAKPVRLVRKRKR